MRLRRTAGRPTTRASCRAREPELWRRWVLAFTLGELIGFGGIPVLGGVAALRLTSFLDDQMQSVVLYLVAVAGGFGEGAVLGWFQLRVLRGLLPALDGRRWIVATAAAAALAWACGMLAPTLDEVAGLSAAAQVAIWIPAGLLILLSIGVAQASVLRAVVGYPRRWVVGNVLGWSAGLPWTIVLPAMLPEAAPLAVWVLTFVVAGALMGVTAGAVTGVALLRLDPLSAPRNVTTAPPGGAAAGRGVRRGSGTRGMSGE